MVEMLQGTLCCPGYGTEITSRDWLLLKQEIDRVNTGLEIMK